MSSFVDALKQDSILHEMQKCLDIKLCVQAFGKTYRPEEKRKLAKAERMLSFYKHSYPEKWNKLCELWGK